MNNDVSIGFIGAGNMASALAGGMIANGRAPQSIMLSDLNHEQLKQVANSLNVTTCNTNMDIVTQCPIIVLAVKPQVMQSVVTELRDSLQAQKPLLISIAAGITLDKLEHWLGSSLPMVRCMPNTPALVRQGASALYANKVVNEQQKKLAQTIFEAVGHVEWLDQEEHIDIVTALSGSGPAYFFLMLEAMIKAAVDQGLDEACARQLAIQTAIGASMMAQQSDVDIGVLRQRVTSPKGTTEAALKSFAANHYDDIVKQAMDAARHRSIELSRE